MSNDSLSVMHTYFPAVGRFSSSQLRPTGNARLRVHSQPACSPTTYRVACDYCASLVRSLAGWRTKQRFTLVTEQYCYRLVEQSDACPCCVVPPAAAISFQLFNNCKVSVHFVFLMQVCCVNKNIRLLRNKNSKNRDDPNK